MRGLWLLLAFLFVTGSAAAQEYGTEFLFLHPSAAAAGMGETGVAHLNGPWAIYANPSGLAGGSGNEASISYRSWVAGQNVFGAAARLGVGPNGALGAVVQGLTAGENGGANQQHTTAGLAYAHRIGWLRAGLTGRYVSEKIGSSSAYGFGLDAGLQLATKDERLQAGVAITNLGLVVRESENLQPPFLTTLRVGAAIQPIRLLDDDGELMAVPLLAVDYVVADIDGLSEQQWHVGLGVEIFEYVTARAGYISNNEPRGLTVGLGLRQGGISIDYALQPYNQAFEHEGTGHVISLAYSW